MLNLLQGTELQIVLMAGAGPLFSLVFGCLILYISINFIKPSLIKLFMTWLGMGGVLGLLGYLLISTVCQRWMIQEEYSHI
jgi:hypothetical protein